MKKIKFSLFIIFTVVIILKGKEFLNNYIELNDAKKENAQLKEEFSKKQKDLENVMKGSNKEKYFRQEYKVSKNGEVLFVFPEDEESNSS